MKTLTQLSSTAGTNKSVSRALMAFAFSLGLATASQATPITGDPLPAGPFTWNDGGPASTNALNYAMQTPGHIGQTTPHVLFSSNTSGSVILDFFNLAPGVAFFETRIDGIATGGTAHAVVTGDTQHTGGTFLPSGATLLGKTFLASNYVDIRLALGAESDFRFDWTRFEVAAPAASVPESGGTLAMLGLGLAAIGFARRRK